MRRHGVAGVHLTRYVFKGEPTTEPEAEPSGLQRKDSKKWAPTLDEIKAGFAYIRETAPESNELLQQNEWVLISIKTDTPVKERVWFGHAIRSWV